MAVFRVKQTFVTARGDHDMPVVYTIHRGQLFMAEDWFDLPTPRMSSNEGRADYYEEIEPASIFGRRKGDRG